MITCPKCNKELNDGTKFCDGCGAQISETVFCPNCGKQTSTEFAFCQSCGAPITGRPAPAPTAPAGRPAPAAKPTVASIGKSAAALTKKLPIPKNVLMFGGIGIAAIVLLVIVIALFSGGKKENNFALYVKDSEIYFTDLKKNSEAQQLTSNFDPDDEYDNIGFASNTYELGLSVYMSEDGKYLFFPDKYDEADYGFTLYFKEVSDLDEDGIKIDSDIVSYTVNEDATLVTYVKDDGDEDNLYQYNIKKDSKEKMASDIDDYKVSADGKKICYITDENDVYLKNGSKDKEKLASEIGSLKYISDDFKTIYYTKEEALYKQVVGGDKEKILSDIYRVLKIYESGEIYYLTTEDEESSLMDYVTDDKKDADASFDPYTYPTYPSWWDYDTDAEYEAAYAEYEDACAEWDAAYNRISMREALQNRTLSTSGYSLYYFDGKEKVLITDSFSTNSYTIASKAPVIVYTAYNQANFEKIKISEIESIYDVESLVEAALFSSSERYAAVKNNATLIEQEKEASSFRINSEGTAIYYIDNIADEKNYGDLYRIAVSKKSIEAPEVYDEDVYYGYGRFINSEDDEQFAYFKDYKNGKGELYIDKVKIDSDVKSSGLKFDEDKAYYSRWRFAAYHN